MVDTAEHFITSPRVEVVVWAQPDDYLCAGFVDFPHEWYLLILLCYRRLVNANGVDPENSLFASKA